MRQWEDINWQSCKVRKFTGRTGGEPLITSKMLIALDNWITTFQLNYFQVLCCVQMHQKWIAVLSPSMRDTEEMEIYDWKYRGMRETVLEHVRKLYFSIIACVVCPQSVNPLISYVEFRFMDWVGYYVCVKWLKLQSYTCYNTTCRYVPIHCDSWNGVLTVRQNRCIPCSGSSVAVVLSKLNGSPFTEAKRVEKS